MERRSGPWVHSLEDLELETCRDSVAGALDSHDHDACESVRVKSGLAVRPLQTLNNTTSLTKDGEEGDVHPREWREEVEDGSRGQQVEDASVVLRWSQ